MKQKREDLKVWLTIRNDDFYMMRWGSPEFIRKYLANMPVSALEGVYLGADGYTWGYDYLEEGKKGAQFIDKMWYFFSIWGKLAYDIDCDDSLFVDEIRYRLDIADKMSAGRFSSCWTKASMLIPYQQCIHWHDFDFQWYPEGSCLYLPQFHEIRFADINEFVQGKAIPNDEYVSIEEYCKKRITTKQNPFDIANSMIELASSSLKELSEIREISTDKEFKDTFLDIEAMDYLGLYYGFKILAAISLYRIRYQGNREELNECISNMQQAAGYWKKYSASISARYTPQFLTRLCGRIDVKSFDTLVDRDIEIIKEEIL